MDVVVSVYVVELRLGDLWWGCEMFNVYVKWFGKKFSSVNCVNVVRVGRII